MRVFQHRRLQADLLLSRLGCPEVAKSGQSAERPLRVVSGHSRTAACGQKQT